MEKQLVSDDKEAFKCLFGEVVKTGAWRVGCRQSRSPLSLQTSDWNQLVQSPKLYFINPPVKITF